MIKGIFAVFILLANLVAASDDMTQRQWLVPEMTPIVEVYVNDGEDPFDAGPLVTIQSFDEAQIELWLKSQGVSFPSGSSAKYVRKKNGGNSLIVKNTSDNLELVDHVLNDTYPVHTSLQLLKRFLSETEGKTVAELPTIIRKYPAQSLGPLRNIVEELAKFDGQLAVDLGEKLKNTVSVRRERIIKILPGSIKATRAYFETMTRIMAE